jgi:hypothetical protein
MMLLLESGFAHHGMWHTVLKSCGLSGAYRVHEEGAPQSLFADEHFTVDAMLIETLESQKSDE